MIAKLVLLSFSVNERGRQGSTYHKPASKRASDGSEAAAGLAAVVRLSCSGCELR